MYMYVYYWYIGNNALWWVSVECLVFAKIWGMGEEYPPIR